MSKLPSILDTIEGMRLLTPEEEIIMKEFSDTMKNETIPAIVEAIKKRQESARRIKNRGL